LGHQIPPRGAKLKLAPSRQRDAPRILNEKRAETPHLLTSAFT
jgi:hypothetical protein